MEYKRNRYGLLLAKDRSKNGMDTTGLLSVIFPNFSLMLSAADGSSLRAEKTSLSYYDDKLNKKHIYFGRIYV